MKNTRRQGRAASAAYRISLLYWLDTMILNDMLSPLGLRRGVMAALADVLENEGIVQDRVNALTGVDKSATARALQTLEGMGLVARREDPSNKRRKLVYPTDAARGIAPEFFGVLRANNEALFAGFTEAEREQCLDYLDRMAANARRRLGRGE
jgi:DNA-binding MarR family transcriptional regulator